jgi:hypothetical protein
MQEDTTPARPEGAAPALAPSVITVQVSKRWLAGFATVLLLPWLLFLLFGTHNPLRDRIRDSFANQEMAKRRLPCSKGPWGDLRIVRIVTEPPEESLSGYLRYPKPVWQFRGQTPETFQKLLASANLDPSQRSELEGLAQWGTPGSGCVVSPPDGLVLGLSPESRSVLYGALSLFPENTFQHEPFRFRTDLADEWFANSNIPESTLEQVRRLIYRRGKTLLFSDPHLIVPALQSDRERVKLLKTLARQSTLMVQLHISQSSDIDSLISYWGARSGRAKDIKPLLESAARIPSGLDIDITHLLPRFARKRIYTYPSSDGDMGELVFDCHWNSMNFWNDPPDNRFSDSATVIQTLETDYEQILDNYRFGDILLFMKSDTQAIHSAVYIADDIVFTKNGPSPHSPWILMQLATLAAHYETNVDLKIRGYRKKKSER